MPAFLIALLILTFAVEAPGQSLEDEIRAMRAEIQMLRGEIDVLRQELRGQDVVPLLQAQVEEHAQTKVETNARFPMKIFGTIVSNTFFNRQGADWMDVPNIATGRSEER